MEAIWVLASFGAEFTGRTVLWAAPAGKEQRLTLNCGKKASAVRLL
jgi:hypothetical protein